MTSRLANNRSQPISPCLATSVREKTDAREQRDVRRALPAVFERMRKQLTAMYRDVRDEAPTWPEWEFARYEAQRIEWPRYWRKRKGTP